MTGPLAVGAKVQARPSAQRLPAQLTAETFAWTRDVCGVEWLPFDYCHTSMDPYTESYFQEAGKPGVDKWGNEVSNTNAMLSIAHREGDGEDEEQVVHGGASFAGCSCLGNGRSPSRGFAGLHFREASRGGKTAGRSAVEKAWIAPVGTPRRLRPAGRRRRGFP